MLVGTFTVSCFGQKYLVNVNCRKIFYYGVNRKSWTFLVFKEVVQGFRITIVYNWGTCMSQMEMKRVKIITKDAQISYVISKL